MCVRSQWNIVNHLVDRIRCGFPRNEKKPCTCLSLVFVVVVDVAFFYCIWKNAFKRFYWNPQMTMAFCGGVTNDNDPIFSLSLSLFFIIALCISRSLANSLLVLYFLRCACDKTVHYWSLTCFITVSIILHLDLVRSRVWSVFWVQGEEEKRNGILWRHVWLAIFFIYVFRYSLICDDPDSFLLHCTNKCQFIYW